MKTGTIITAWKDETHAHAAVRVAEGGAAGDVEYVVSVPLLDEQGAPKTGARLKAELTEAVRQQRGRQAASASALGGMAGTVSL